MTYGQQPKPKGKGLKIIVIILAVIVAILGVFACMGVIKGASGATEGKDKLITTTSPGEAVGKAGATAANSAAPRLKVTPVAPPPTKLTTSGIKLTIKTTSKECFGSAGCNVQWTIKAALAEGVHITDPCDVTYEVRGLDDPQTHTLTVKNDESYDQDSFSFGQTKRSSSKLTAVVTEVECQ